MYNHVEDRHVGVPVGNGVYDILVGYRITVGDIILRLEEDAEHPTLPSSRGDLPS